MVGEGSPLVEVDEAGLRVRPANKRCTVILREIPQDTRVEVIHALVIIVVALWLKMCMIRYNTIVCVFNVQ